jgi:hypothetical protein
VWLQNIATRYIQQHIGTHDFLALHLRPQTDICFKVGADGPQAQGLACSAKLAALVAMYSCMHSPQPQPLLQSWPHSTGTGPCRYLSCPCTVILLALR